MKQLIDDFEEELYDLYHSTKSMDLTPTSVKKSKKSSDNEDSDNEDTDDGSIPNAPIVNDILRAKIVEFNHFKLILYETVDGYVWIDVNTLIKHISLIDKVTTTQSKKSTAKMDKLKERVDETPDGFSEYFTIDVKGIYNKTVNVRFIPICDLPHYCRPYANNLIKFMSKTFVNGDNKGWIYYNLVIDDNTGKVIGVKVGRTKDLTSRNWNYNSQDRFNGKHLETKNKIYVSERARAEDIWRFFLNKNSDKISSIVQDTEWLMFSDDEEEMKEQAATLESIWNEYVSSEEIVKLLIKPPEEKPKKSPRKSSKKSSEQSSDNQ